MITMTNLGNKGQLGNQLFEIASLIGIADKNNQHLGILKWKYSKYFIGIFNEYNYIKDDNLVTIKEKQFHYEDNLEISKFNDTNLDGYFQSDKYFKHIEESIRAKLTFTQAFQDECNVKLYEAYNKSTIGIHIRRGDYVNNPNYYQLPIKYYILALFEEFKYWEEKNIIIFSDDIEYCKIHFSSLSNVYFSEGNSDIEDLYLMSKCDDYILSNSTFSWWAAWLGETENSKVVRPTQHFDGTLALKNDIKDFYPNRWTSFNHENKRINLTDVTFTIPVKYDSQERLENYHLSISYLTKDFDTNILVEENQTIRDNEIKFHNNNVSSLFIFENEVFHRTKMLNIMTRVSNTKYIANWDCDIIIPTLQIWSAVNELRNGCAMVYPYDGRFARLPRQEWLVKLNSYMDIGIVQNTIFNGMRDTDNLNSVGGAVFFNRKSFIEGGMENENFISFGAEDVERKIRFEKLGYWVKRVKGCLYHINHWVGLDSTIQNPNYKANQEECNRIARMTKEELIKEIETWKWVK